MTSVFIEAGFVGVAAAFAFAVACFLLKPTGLMQLAGVGFVTGAALHLVFEVLGLNAMYCTTGAACAR